MIKYIGSKRRLAPTIAGIARALGASSAVDLFSGSARVARELKLTGLYVVANDHNAYAYTLARCYVQVDAAIVRNKLASLIDELNNVPACPGWFTETYCVRSQFFHPDNGAKIDAIRDRIESLSLDPDLECVALTALMEAADKVDATVGHYMAHLKSWPPRALKPLRLTVPEVTTGPGLALMLDAHDAAMSTTANMAYLDPPYNTCSYRSAYHVWESLVRWDRPCVYGATCKRLDCKTHKSAFNSRRDYIPALCAVVNALNTSHLVLSLSDDSLAPPQTVTELLCEWGIAIVLSCNISRYIGYKLGIYNREGQKVRAPSRSSVKERLFIASKDADAIRRVLSDTSYWHPMTVEWVDPRLA